MAFFASRSIMDAHLRPHDPSPYGGFTHPQTSCQRSETTPMPREDCCLDLGEPSACAGAFARPPAGFSPFARPCRALQERVPGVQPPAGAADSPREPADQVAQNEATVRHFERMARLLAMPPPTRRAPSPDDHRGLGVQDGPCGTESACRSGRCEAADREAGRNYPCCEA